MTPAELITKEARFWLGLYAKASAEGGPRSSIYAGEVTKVTAQVLCPHHHIVESGTIWQCRDCGGYSK